MKLHDVTPQNVNAAVALFIAAVRPDGTCFNSGTVYWYVRKQLGIPSDSKPDGMTAWERNHNENLLLDRVKRALDAAAKRGELVRLGKNMRTPGGSRLSTPVYYTLDGYSQAVADALAGQDAAAALAARWRAVHSVLEALGLDDTGYDGSSPELEIDTWERLVAMLPAQEGSRM
jgi:hypothetical protein